jgi:DNA replication protein DnaC
MEQMGQNTQYSLDENEYIGEDGLVYCKKCNTRKQTEVMGMKMPIMCKCRQEERQRAEEDFERRQKRERIEELKRSSLLGEKYRDARFENTETIHSEEFKGIYNRCKRYCDVSADVLKSGIGIYLFGTKGTGKSRLTACMGNELMKKYHTVLYTNFSEIGKKIIETKNDFVEELEAIDFLFIDDFGTEKVTKNNEDIWLQEKVFEVINRRYINNKPIIFTSNYSLQELIRDRGVADKTVDRIIEMCEIMKLQGQSYRVTAMRQREKLF